MEYTREITDMIMIQYIILFAMAKSNRIVTHNQLTTLVLDNCNINFTDFQIALDNLANIGFIRLFNAGDNNQYCELLPKGVESNSFFQSFIPVYIREPLEKSIAPFFHEEELKKSIRTELIPLNEKEFLAECGIFEGNTPLMKLSVYAGARKTAADMLRQFKNDPEKFYRLIISALSENTSDEEDKYGKSADNEND